jgi:hypothetical protein
MRDINFCGRKIILLIIAFFGINFLLIDHCIALPPISEHRQIQFYSQAAQDQFVYLLLYQLLDKQDTGYYLEIGAGHPSHINNSYFLEKDLGWKGISLDITSAYKNMWSSTRDNPLLIEDARQSDYTSILKSFPEVIDYLSLDIDADYDIVLNRIPFNDHVFKIITIEHDAYRYGDRYRKEERRILSSLGYYLLCSDVCAATGFYYEDWWIYPSAFPSDVLLRLTSLDLKEKYYEPLLNTLQDTFELGKNK